MKKWFVVAMLGMASAVSSVSAAPAAADAMDSYVSVSVGHAKYKFSGDSETNTGFGFAYGQKLSDITGYEFGYANLGSLDDGTGHGLYLAGVARYPLADAFSVYGKIGPTVNHLSGDDSDTRVRLLLGAGVSYQFDKNWAAILEYTHFGKSVGLTPTLWSVGARYHF